MARPTNEQLIAHPVENPQDPVRKSPKHITNQKEFYQTKTQNKTSPKEQPKTKTKTKTLYEELVFGSRVGWGLEFGNTKLSNSKPEGTQVVIPGPGLMRRMLPGSPAIPSIKVLLVKYSGSKAGRISSNCLLTSQMSSAETSSTTVCESVCC